MKIGVIQASSQKEKNAMLMQCVQKAAEKNGRDDEVINFGVYADEETVCSYVETALSVSLLLCSQAVDFVVTGCSSGQGMMLACSSLPGVMCGFVETPQDAFLFGRINGGNAVSVPLGLNFGWLGEISLQSTLDRLFEGEFGCGYPPQDAQRKQRDAQLVKQLNALTKRGIAEVLPRLDPVFVSKALRPSVRDYILKEGKNREIIEMIQTLQK
ncbi:MAG: RpiB/LacA/LacB family sugar-phosphate isomerase [Solobacterium sp.]|nr:RpiB/LacA/LacB family sugar-phosphate isomerase [Solobacterium sp.]